MLRAASSGRWSSRACRPAGSSRLRSRKLKAETFGQIASEDAGRVELLEPCEHRLDPRQIAAEKRRYAVERTPEITVLIEQVEQVQRNQLVTLVGKIGSDLLQHVLAQSARPRRGLFDPRAVVAAEPAVAAAAPVSRFFGEIERPVPLRSRGGMPMLGSVRRQVVDKTLRKRRGRGLFGGGRGVAGGRRLLAGPLAPIEKRVLLDFGVDEIVELEVRELQHFDRLLQLRRHHQRLRLAQLKPLRKTHPIHITLRSERLIG